jgi:hypothetical protein
VEDGQQIAFSDFECAIRALLSLTDRGVVAILLQALTKYVLDTGVALTSLQRLALFNILKAVNTHSGLKLGAVKALFFARLADLSGFEEMVIEYLKASIEAFVDVDQWEDRTAIPELWESHARYMELAVESMVDDSQKVDMEYFYATQIGRLIVKCENEEHKGICSEEIVPSPSTDPKRTPTPPPTMSTNPYASPPVKERHFRHVNPVISRSVSSAHSFLGHRRHPSSSGSSNPSLSLNVSPVRMNSFTAVATMSPPSPSISASHPANNNFLTPSPLHTPGSSHVPSTISSLSQLHLQHLMTVYLNHLPDPTQWTQDLIRRVLPTLFAILGMWAFKEPLPRIGVGKERLLPNRSKSVGKKGSGGTESEAEALKRRVERAIGQCCGGAHEWVVLEVIKESSCPIPRGESYTDDTSTPTPTIANTVISESDEAGWLSFYLPFLLILTTLRSGWRCSDWWRI